MKSKQGSDAMPDDDNFVSKTVEVEQNPLSPAARRALEEAETRRKQAEAAPKPPREVDGRNGPDPARYGDWEKKGIASDF